MSAPEAAAGLRPVGDRAVLVELPDTEHALALARAVRRELGDRVTEVVPGHRTVLVAWSPGAVAPEPELARLLAAVRPASADDGDEVVIEVRYDGPDLVEVATACGLSVEEVVRRHREAAYRVAFVGFAPGFGYLTGGDPRLHVPRREEPRTRVPAGSVAIAGPYCAIYPSASPGGWRLLGTTERTLFDPDRDPPALLAPGTRVLFRDAG